jgi:hypothetical protein
MRSECREGRLRESCEGEGATPIRPPDTFPPPPLSVGHLPQIRQNYRRIWGRKRFGSLPEISFVVRL